MTFGPERPLGTTEPFDGATLLRFLSRFAVPGVERHDEVDGHPRLTRAVRLPHGPGLLRLRWTGSALLLAYAGDWRDAAVAESQARRLCDADADVAAVAGHLGSDPHLASLVASSPGLRVPGATEPADLAFQTLIGQQISMAAAARCAEKITLTHGEAFDAEGQTWWLFPTAAALAGAEAEELPMPRARGRALVALARALESGALDLDRERAWPDVRRDLLAQPGIGPWTADAIGMRGLGQPDVLLGTDLVIKRELVARGVIETGAWSPFRSYATIHLWRAYV